MSRYEELMISRARQLVLGIIAIAIAVAGPSTADALRDQPPATPGPQGRYLIGPEDVLDVVVWNNAEMTRTVTVRPDGMISLPLLNDVQAAGLTAMEVRDVLISRFTEYMPGPEVSVIVREVKSAKVTVIGEVRMPGRYDIKTRSTVMDVLAQAGPFTQFASLGGIFVLRADGPATKRMSFDYKKALSRRGNQENFVLEAGDIIVVP